MALFEIHQRFKGHFLKKLSFKNSQGLELNSVDARMLKPCLKANCMISVILLFHTFNLSSCINLVITKYKLKSQYVKLTQLWSLTVNWTVSSTLSDRIIIKLSNIFWLCIYADQMIIQQRFNVLLELQFYNIFSKILSILSKSFH